MRIRTGLLATGGIAVTVALLAGLRFGVFADNLGTARGPITVETATSVLRRAEAHAQARDFEALCNMGDAVSMCQHWLRDVRGAASVPVQPPEIVRTYLIPSSTTQNGTSTGGRVLVLKGIDGLGRAYTTEFLVFDAGSHGPAALHPVYWSGIRMSSGER
ncbi:MAG: hypothetical protein M3P51_15240 [Chloroflexota bacterium]|nr:hypothetical protein [Chloroflexota bacterium]